MIKIKSTSKRGRKPKEINFGMNSIKEEPALSCLEEKIILRLPITLERIKELSFSSINQKQHVPNSNNLEKKHIEPVVNKHNYTYNGAKGKQIETVIYDTINLFPSEIGVEEFARIKLTNTDIACWWCTYQFDTYPVCMPDKYIGKQDIFKVHGCFCSFNCALAFKMEKNIKADQYLVSFMHKKLTGSFKSIKKAPSPYCLKKFGGPISIEDYRKTFQTGRDISIHISPMVFIPYQIEDSRSSEMLRNNVIKFNDDTDKYTSNSLSLSKIKDASKRQKITKSTKIESNSNTLDKIMGFK
jgi:hypothetical protein